MANIKSMSANVLNLSFCLGGEQCAQVKFSVNDILHPYSATIELVYREWYILLLDLNRADTFSQNVDKAKQLISPMKKQTIGQNMTYLLSLMPSTVTEIQQCDMFIQILVEALYKVTACYWAERSS